MNQIFDCKVDIQKYRNSILDLKLFNYLSISLNNIKKQKSQKRKM